MTLKKVPIKNALFGRTPRNAACCSAKELKHRRTHLLDKIATTPQCTGTLYIAPSKKDENNPNFKAAMCIEGVMAEAYRELSGKGEWQTLTGHDHTSRVRTFALDLEDGTTHRSEGMAPDEVYDFFGLQRDSIKIAPTKDTGHPEDSGHYEEDEYGDEDNWVGDPDAVFTQLIDANDKGTTFAVIRSHLAKHWRLDDPTPTPLNKKQPLAAHIIMSDLTIK